MKRVLQSDNNGVLVYVAPTKALVNQIAAEINGRFAKSYPQNAKSKTVWAIHTRDYRINNPEECQILVTVPHILQIMLLAPTNAEKENSSWSYRLRRIIFDEVHCIGQAEDGIIWEQLLLLAPCPIIALSATVGNPEHFKSWLEGTERAKGHKLHMVAHQSRYSELRKYWYKSPIEFTFRGLLPKARLPVPGLEGECSESSHFHFIHPVASLINRNRDTLEDIDLEPRDCLALWRCMKKHETETFPVGSSLDPANRLPATLKKSDVAKWATELKVQLQSWMRDPQSPFNAVRKHFRSDMLRVRLPLDESLPAKATEHEFGMKIEMQPNNSRDTNFSLLVDLQRHGALPALIFHYDRTECEAMLVRLLGQLKDAEDEWKNSSSEWAEKMSQYMTWKKTNEKIRSKGVKSITRAKGKGDDSVLTGKEAMIEEASKEPNVWASFDPAAVSERFSFADITKLSNTGLQGLIDDHLKRVKLQGHFIEGLRRGVGVHHAGMNRAYRQLVEILFRKGFLTVVIATGTLALGINMPCKTVVFAGDSVLLTALNYRQASGRAGRRGFDLLGNVVFHGIPLQRVFEIMSSKLPDLKGHFPMSTTLVLRLLSLLHHTKRSQFAKKSFDSLLSQNRLYLGGPASQIAIKHHVRFSIEYLRRQHLLSADGVPLNFSGLVGHLYFTENAVFAFHTLLKEGYFNRVCADINQQTREKKILETLVLVLSHIFCRIPCRRHMDEAWLKNVVHRSSSIILLPGLPEEAESILRAYNKETLNIFRTYVQTYIRQHLANVADCVLPFTKHEIKPAQPWNHGRGLDHLPRSEIRSPFAALSGHTDEFKSIRDLCSNVRDGVFLEESAVPYIPIFPHDTDGVPFNAYIYDFFRHGDLKALVEGNGLKKGDVWFHLKDFSLVLATIVTSLANFIKPEAGDDLDMLDVLDAGDALSDEEGSKEQEPADPAIDLEAKKEATTTRKLKPNKKVIDCWEDDATDDDEGIDEGDSSLLDDSTLGDSSPEPARAPSPAVSAPAWEQGNKENLLNVLKAFSLLREEFDAKFKKVWA